MAREMTCARRSVGGRAPAVQRRIRVTVGDLPIEIITQIANHFTDITDLIRFGGTCKMWREASHSAPHLTARTHSKCSFRDLAEFISRLPDLQRLDLSRCPSTPEIEFLTFLRFLALRCTSLRYLSVAFPILTRCKSSGEQLGNDHWEKAKTANDQVLFSGLQHLNISNASNAVVELLMKQAPKVSVLIASGVQLADLPSDLTHVDLCNASTFSLAMFSQAHRHGKLPRLEKVLASKRLGLADMSDKDMFAASHTLVTYPLHSSLHKYLAQPNFYVRGRGSLLAMLICGRATLSQVQDVMCGCPQMDVRGLPDSEWLNPLRFAQPSRTFSHFAEIVNPVTPLTEAIQRCNAELVGWLLEQGAYPDPSTLSRDEAAFLQRSRPYERALRCFVNLPGDSVDNGERLAAVLRELLKHPHIRVIVDPPYDDFMGAICITPLTLLAYLHKDECKLLLRERFESPPNGELLIGSNASLRSLPLATRREVGLGRYFFNAIVHEIKKAAESRSVLSAPQILLLIERIAVDRRLPLGGSWGRYLLKCLAMFGSALPDHASSSVCNVRRRVVELLLRLGAVPNGVPKSSLRCTFDSPTVLDHALAVESESCVRALLAAGASVASYSVREETGGPLRSFTTWLAEAVVPAHRQRILRMLLEAGASTASVLSPDESSGRTLTHDLAQYDHVDVLTSLTRDGLLPVDTPDALGVTPLMVAVQNNRANAVRALLAAGADINARESIFGRTPLLVGALGMNEPMPVDALTALLQHNADIPVNEQLNVNMRDRSSRTALFGNFCPNMAGAAFKSQHTLSDGEQLKHARLLRLLIEAGLDTTVRSGSGATPHVMKDAAIRLWIGSLRHGDVAETTVTPPAPALRVKVEPVADEDDGDISNVQPLFRKRTRDCGDSNVTKRLQLLRGEKD